MAEINLLRRYPRAKRNIEKRTGAQSEANIRIARQYGANTSTGRATRAMAGIATMGDGSRSPRT